MISEIINDNLPALIIIVPLLIAYISPFLKQKYKTIHIVTIIFSVLNMFLVFCMYCKYRISGEIVYTFGAIEHFVANNIGLQFPVRIMLIADGLSILMGLSISIIFLSVSIYSISYAKKQSENGHLNQNLHKYYALLFLGLASMNGLVMTGDIFNMFVFLEVLSLAATGMIIISKSENAPEAGFKFIVISTIASLFILFAIAMTYGQYGTLNIAMLSKLIQFTIIDKVALCLMISGFAMKCGAVPMHMWIPDAYSKTPSSLSALFVIISQISLYALLRTVFTLYGFIINYHIVGLIIIILGVLSMVGGILMALPQKDIKRLMSYHAISQTGYMLLGLGVGLAVLNNPEKMIDFGFDAMNGGIFHIVNHALYKGLLFLTAGSIFYLLGTTNMNEMGGLARKKPMLTILFIIGAFAIAGIPPFNGFASKFILYESVYHFHPALTIIAMVVSILTLASFVKVLYSAFLRYSEKTSFGTIPKTMMIGMSILAVLIILMGLFPGFVLDNFITPATNALVNHIGYSQVIMP